MYPHGGTRSGRRGGMITEEKGRDASSNLRNGDQAAPFIVSIDSAELSNYVETGGSRVFEERSKQTGASDELRQAF